MKTISISELRANLSRYLREAHRGGEIQVLNRGVPVARLIQPGTWPADDNPRRQQLERAGLIRMGRGGAEKILRLTLIRSRVNLRDALANDREDRV
jgi:prevent-host-death family protein